METYLNPIPPLLCETCIFKQYCVINYIVLYCTGTVCVVQHKVVIL